jgi:hypothetical protein
MNFYKMNMMLLMTRDMIKSAFDSVMELAKNVGAKIKEPARDRFGVVT